MRPTSICLINQKGGCGKSSTCFHLAGHFAKAGKRVLLVDADPQGSLSQGFFGSRLVECLEPQETLAAAFREDAILVPEALCVDTPLDRITIIRANQHLAAQNTPCPETAGLKQFALQAVLARIEGFDLVLIDCPPNLYQCTWNAVVAADFVLIPVPPEDFGTQGLRPVHQAIQGAQLLNPRLMLLGHVVTRYDRRLLVHQAYEQKLRRLYGPAILKTVIPEASAFKVSLACRQPVSHFAPRSKAAFVTGQLAEEIETRIILARSEERIAGWVSLRRRLATIETHLLESIGSRPDGEEPRLAPTPVAKDIGRRPASGFGSVEIDQVVPDPDQPRTEFTPEALNRLADSIRDKGQLAPIRVRWSDDVCKWVIVAGERRWRATKQAGLPRIECYFHSGELSRSEVLEQQLIENLLREDLKPIEEAQAFASLMELNGWNGKQVAQQLRIPPSRVSRVLALLRLPEEVRRSVDAGELSARSAYELSRLSDPRQQRLLADQAAKGNLTHDQTARLVRQRRGKRRNQPRRTRLSFLTEHGWKIIVSAARRGSYYEVEQALEEALAEVRHRIRNDVQIL